MIFTNPPESESALRAAITDAYRQDETDAVQRLAAAIYLSAEAKNHIQTRASKLVEEVRKQRVGKSGIDSFMYQYNLSNEEGIALMCLAEALLRIPDSSTIDKLIQDKITKGDWQAHLGASQSLFVNAATWGLMLTGKIYAAEEKQTNKLSGAIKGLIKRSGEPIVRKAISHAMRVLGKQFVMGRTIKEALTNAKEIEAMGYRHSYDMLGEAARTQTDAEKYFQAYQQAIAAIAKVATKDIYNNPSISVKLSALHPRYEFTQAQRAIADVAAKLKILALQAKAANIGLTVDAEEADRLDLSLDILEIVFKDNDLAGWEGLGLALQSYQKRAWFIIDWLVVLSRQYNKRWMVRLIKGAYWDYEIKRSQEMGLGGYPVFTRKMNTDVSFLSCAQKILTFPQQIYPQFATHNAHSVATILELVGDRTDYEFQCLHGMGRALYDQVVDAKKLNRPCRIYAPVGSHEDLLPYLVRRLLENGANSSFVNRIVDAKQPIAEIIADPIEKIKNLKSITHPKIPLPRNIYQPQRLNSKGLDLSNRKLLLALKSSMDAAAKKTYYAQPTFLSQATKQQKPVINPADHRQTVGFVIEADADDMQLALTKADNAAFTWDNTSVLIRAGYLEKAADLFEQHQAELMTLAVKEAGKSIIDAVSEVREAIDFCRYYAAQARIHMTTPQQLVGPTGEYNELQLHGRGTIICISPWNFPLAIFTGQITAALVMGNPVIAKPAEPTPLIAARAVELFHQAGVPREVLQLLPTKGRLISQHLLPDPRVKGVVFTGSTETAQIINKTLAARTDQIVPFIAETGGQNAMIVDSSALIEQVVADVVNSAFNSAGQRCSALRVLFVQEEIADKLIAMLQGAMQELVIGDPSYLNTDVGPVIDAEAKENLEEHLRNMREQARLIYQIELPKMAEYGSFVSPSVFELSDLSLLKREVFGPVLHVIRYKESELNQVISAINNTGYGLTLGVHTRIEETARTIQQHVQAGNCYVNRNMIGAVVGVQPFGGEKLSGTGPKAGGPHYLLRFCLERSLSVNTAAVGGNASLMVLEDSED